MASKNNHILEEVEWGKPVLRLLDQSKNLKREAPASLIIRHSERNKIEKASETQLAGLTDRGRDAAYNFGQRLPSPWGLRIIHSPIIRCKQTATNIHEGAASAGLKSEVVGELKLLWGPEAEWDTFSQLLIRDWPQSYNHWMSGRYPLSVVEPSIEYAKRLAGEFEKNSSQDMLTIYVAHDTQILSLLFHWFGIPPKIESASFLNGFFVQKIDGKLVLLTGEAKSECEAPHWWRVNT